MFKYRCWAQKALDTFLQILSWWPPSGSLRVLVFFFFYTPLGEFQLFLEMCPKGPPSPWPFFVLPVSEPPALALITNGERKSQSSSCAAAQRAASADCRRVGTAQTRDA